MSSYEIEIKSLLGAKENVDGLIERMKTLDPSTELSHESTQLNHYFEGGNLGTLYEGAKDLFNKEQQKKLKNIIEEGSSFSIRTREINGEVRLVLKASIGDDTSANGVSRIEFDEPVPEMTLDDLDQVLLDSGFSYQAKWSRERKEYACKDVNICIDKNAGYGYLAEFEKVVGDRESSENIEREIRDLMTELECEELAQDRLERMFAYYNEHWPDYYGTDNVFIIE